MLATSLEIVDDDFLTDPEELYDHLFVHTDDSAEHGGEYYSLSGCGRFDTGRHLIPESPVDLIEALLMNQRHDGVDGVEVLSDQLIGSFLCWQEIEWRSIV